MSAERDIRRLAMALVQAIDRAGPRIANMEFFYQMRGFAAPRADERFAAELAALRAALGISKSEEENQ